MLDEVDKAQERYKEQFGRYFPRASLLGVSGEDLVKEIDKCIRVNKPFQPDIPEGAVI